MSHPYRDKNRCIDDFCHWNTADVLINILIMYTDLTKFSLFRDMSQADLAVLAPYFSYAEFPAGATLFSQGDLADRLFLVVSGEIKINYKPYDSPKITITRIRDGDVLGWSTVLGNKSYTASAVCDCDAGMLVINGDDLRKLVADHPQTGKMVLDSLASAASPRWKDARAQVGSMLRKGMEFPDHYDGGGIMNETSANGFTKEMQLKALVDQLSAYIETYHGGSVEFVALEKDTLKVHLGGACLGCPLSPVTLHGWVEGTVRQFFPEIAHVEAV
jgi:Fe-S cluster biogenesis protein NfuA